MLPQLSYLWPGSNHLYVFMNPLRPDKTPDLPDVITWEFGQKEIAQAKGFATAGGTLTKGVGLSIPSFRLKFKIQFSGKP